MILDTVLISSALLTLVAGIVVAKFLRYRRQKRHVSERLAQLFPKDVARPYLFSLLKERRLEKYFSVEQTLQKTAFAKIDLLIEQSGSSTTKQNLSLTIVCLFLFPVVVTAILEFDLMLGVLFGTLLAAFPICALFFKRNQLRKKFVTQLPDAIDLMVSVLRSGHSIPQAVKTVGEELPAPLGKEFLEVQHRMNLGQPLSQALVYSCEKFASFELDLIRRAATIQAETGGSLAELLDKTNGTLRQRLKLVRQVTVLTAQSRMTGTIVSLLPFVMAVSLHYLSPGYLNPLLETSLGKLLLTGSLCLMLLGALIMRRMSTVKV
ncbi:MAG: type II secretion system F family protein [Leptolyngbya sp.]|nr:type II secretion system F family protein [Candidatus Melainabacteria bacterium]